MPGLHALSRQPFLQKEKINYKLAGDGGYLPHQDGYWQMARAGVVQYKF
jgi:hypothetical protein